MLDGVTRKKKIQSISGSRMTANELFSKMEKRFGRYPDCGVVCTNGEDIKSVVCEIDWYMLYNVMTDPHALYVVHHPVSDYALWLNEIHPDEKQEDIRSEVQNWLLEFTRWPTGCSKPSSPNASRERRGGRS
jgi:hypothetical protein